MAISCSFHRSEPAHFECSECGSAFCGNCLSVRETEGYGTTNRHYFCPGCNIPLDMLSLGNIIQPFQDRLSAFFLYPFQLTPLILTIVLSMLGALFPSSFLVGLFVWVVMMKYAYAALITTGQGGLKAPRVTWELINNDVLQVFKQYIIFAIAGYCAFTAFHYTGVVGGFVFITAVLLAMPAIIMLLVATNSVFHAINPMYFFGLISKIGSPYFLMYLFLFFLMAGPTTLFAYLPADVLPARLYIFFTLFLKQIYALISYHLMGYVLLQYHREIGYNVDYEFFMDSQGGRKKTSKPSPEEEVLTGLAVLIRCEKYDEAIERLLPYINTDNPRLDLSEKFLQLLKMTNQRQRYLRYCLRHLDLLVGRSRKQQALILYDEIIIEKAGVPSAESLFRIGSWYQSRNEFKKAISVYVACIKKHRNNDLIPAVYFELAKLLHERGRNSSKARQILQAMIRSYPDHTLVPQAKKYLLAVS